MRPALSLSVGDAPEPRLIGPVSATDLVRFAGAGGDFNPLHHDEAAARAAGFESIIAMGQFTAGLLAGYLSDWVGIEHLVAFEVRFTSPVSLGDLLELTAAVTAVTGAEAHVDLVARSGDRRVADATATIAQSMR